MKPWIAPAIAVVALVAAGRAQAAEITLIAPGGIRAALEQLIPAFEQKTGNTVKATFVSGGGAKKESANGTYDVPIVQPPVAGVIAAGHVIAKSETPLAIVRVGVAVPPGAKKPDISNAAAVKRALLAARSISYPDPANGAAAGVSFDTTMAKLGITEAMKPKIKIARNGAEAVAMAARGEVDLGITFISEMDPKAGAQRIGPLPRSVSVPTGFVAFVNARTKEPKAAAALIAFLSSRAAATVYKQAGMTPGK